MFNRLAAVALAYATRRLLWLWAAVYGLILICGVMDTHPPSIRTFPAAPVPGPSATAVIKRQELDRLLREGRQDEVAAIDCRREWRDFGSALEAQRIGGGARRPPTVRMLEDLRRRNPLPEFDRFPQLRSLDLTGCVIFPEDAARLARCPRLEWLSLERAVIVDRNLNFISSLPRLSTLILGTVQSSPEEAIELAPTSLPELRTLVLDGSIWETPQMLQALATSPQLRDLVLHYARADAGTIKLVTAIPALRRLFVGTHVDEAASVTRWRTVLPGLAVHHSELSEGRSHGGMFLLFATLCLGTGVLIQTNATFSVPAARLFPGFQTPHALVPAGIIAAGIVLQTLIAGGFGVSLGPALALQIFGVGAFIALGGLGEALSCFPWPRSQSAIGGEPRNDSRLIHLRPFSGLLFLFLIFGGIGYFRNHGYLVESYFLGEMNWAALGLFAAGAIGVGVAFALLPRLSVARGEAGLPSVISMQDVPRSLLKAGSGLRGANRRLARLPRQPSPSNWRWRVAAVRAGNTTTVGMMLQMTIVFSVVWGGTQFYSLNQLTGLSPSAIISPAMLGMMAIVLSVLCAPLWWQRRQTFGASLLYPWTRRQMSLAILVALAIDIVIPTLAAFGLFLIANHWLDWRLPWDVLLMGSIAVMAVAALIIAGAYLLLTLRHGLFAILVAYLGSVILGSFIALTPAFVFGTTPEMFPDRDQLVPYTMFIAAESGAIALVLGAGAYRRWMRTEWGLVGSK